MPLSSALQARLIERGILNASNINAALGLLFFIEKFYKFLFFFFSLLDASAENDDESEEVFAESYDEREEHQLSTATVPKKVFILIEQLFCLPHFFRVISLQTIFKLILKNVLNVQINGIHIILV